ncbi:HAD-IIIA family hydrolase [Halobacillus sp. Marseille-P3879]|uniref:HAD-IIIA family hydrolase n=1 Tax=Halobacillus sp. Marseille-P3879 TaxID=2045014 RepID=UPI000C7B0F65|nr:HAD-IIIA family hydrolase [Halobacillus sp. Marseille-P3879]
MRAVFIDRDGTLGGSDKIEYPGQFQVFEGVLESLKSLKKRGYLLFSFTNQPGIAKGYSSLEEFREELLGFGLDAVYLCSHTPEEGCSCRKPASGMIEKACSDYKIKPQDCFVIGDRIKDIEAGRLAGCRQVLVRTGGGKAAESELEKPFGYSTPDYIAEDLNKAVRWLLTLS